MSPNDIGNVPPSSESGQHGDEPGPTRDGSPSPMGTGAGDGDRWIDRMMDEYKILQDKIDKIGAFRFTVKGWSVTLITAAIAAASGTRIPSLLILALVLVVWAFYRLEHEQSELSLRFGRRAREIENAMILVRAKPTYDLSDRDIPGIATELEKPAVAKTVRQQLKASVSEPAWLIYWIQVILIVVTAVSLYFFRPSSAPDANSVTIIQTDPQPQSPAVTIIQTEPQRPTSPASSIGPNSKKR